MAHAFDGLSLADTPITGSPGTATFNLGWIKHCLMFNGDVLADSVNLARLTALSAGYGLTL